MQLARVLAQIWHPLENERTRLLLLDEPVAGPVSRYQASILARLRAFASTGIAVAIVLHDRALAARYTDRLLVLEAGKVRGWGATSRSGERASKVDHGGGAREEAGEHRGFGNQ